MKTPKHGKIAVSPWKDEVVLAFLSIGSKKRNDMWMGSLSQELVTHSFAKEVIGISNVEFLQGIQVLLRLVEAVVRRLWVPLLVTGMDFHLRHLASTSTSTNPGLGNERRDRINKIEEWWVRRVLRWSFSIMKGAVGTLFDPTHASKTPFKWSKRPWSGHSVACQFLRSDCLTGKR